MAALGRLCSCIERWRTAEGGHPTTINREIDRCDVFILACTASGGRRLRTLSRTRKKSFTARSPVGSRSGEGNRRPPEIFVFLSTLMRRRWPTPAQPTASEGARPPQIARKVAAGAVSREPSESNWSRSEFHRMNRPELLLSLAGAAGAVSLGLFFNLFSKLSPKLRDALANKSKPGKAINIAVLLPLMLLLFLSKGPVHTVTATALTAAVTVLNLIHRRSLIALGFDRSFLVRLQLHSALSFVAVALLIEALASGLLN